MNHTTVSIHPDTPVVVAARLAAYAGYRLEYCASTGRVLMVDSGAAVNAFVRQTNGVRDSFAAAESVTTKEVLNVNG